MSGQNLSAITRFELYLLKNKQHNRFLGLFRVTREFEERMTIAKDRSQYFTLLHGVEPSDLPNNRRRLCNMQ